MGNQINCAKGQFPAVREKVLEIYLDLETTALLETLDLCPVSSVSDAAVKSLESVHPISLSRPVPTVKLPIRQAKQEACYHTTADLSIFINKSIQMERFTEGSG
ncbi:hypothetical protein SRHO_G00072910 [Serrasalmus rhombeus]